MNIVIQCAAGKHGGYFKTQDGREVIFVARPDLAPKDSNQVFAHPDDICKNKQTWREKLIAYNKKSDNPLNLARASELYKNPVYEQLVSAFGCKKVFILSAMWGLVRADFRLPNYDTTFSQSARQNGCLWRIRPKKEVWKDFCDLPSDREPMVFFGGKDYVPFFVRVTKEYEDRKVIFYNSKYPLQSPGCESRLFQSKNHRKWHYECAKAFLDGSISLDDEPLPVSLRIGQATPTSQQHRASNLPKAEDFRQTLSGMLHQAEMEKKPYFDIEAKELHRRVGGYPGSRHRMPQCCSVMYSLMASGDTILSAPPSGQGATLSIRFKLPRKQ